MWLVEQILVVANAKYNIKIKTKTGSKNLLVTKVI